MSVEGPGGEVTLRLWMRRLGGRGGSLGCKIERSAERERTGLSLCFWLQRNPRGRKKELGLGGWGLQEGEKEPILLNSHANLFKSGWREEGIDRMEEIVSGGLGEKLRWRHRTLGVQ